MIILCHLENFHIHNTHPNALYEHAIHLFQVRNAHDWRNILVQFSCAKHNACFSYMLQLSSSFVTLCHWLSLKISKLKDQDLYVFMAFNLCILCCIHITDAKHEPVQEMRLYRNLYHVLVTTKAIRHFSTIQTKQKNTKPSMWLQCKTMHCVHKFDRSLSERCPVAHSQRVYFSVF